MAASHPAPAIKLFGETLSLSATVAYLSLRPQFHQLIVNDPTEKFRLHLNPKILDIVFYDASATLGSRYLRGGSSTTLAKDLTDADTGTGSGTVLDSMVVTDDFLYICTFDIVGGFNFIIGSLNVTTNTIVVQYWDGSTWASLTETDNTDSGGASFAVTNKDVTWTAPTDANQASLGGPNGILKNDNTIVDLTDDTKRPPGDDPPSTLGFWWRISFSTAGLDVDTELTDIQTVNKNSSRGYFRAGQDYEFSIDRGKVGSFEAVATANTDTLEVTHVYNAAQ